MKDKTTLSLIGIILVIVGIICFFIMGSSNGSLVSPQAALSKLTKSSPTPASNIPDTPSYNPPKEFNFNSQTNLSQELDSVNPEVTDSDFSEIKNLTK